MKDIFIALFISLIAYTITKSILASAIIAAVVGYLITVFFTSQKPSEIIDIEYEEHASY